MYQSLTLSAGVAVEFQEDADFIRIMAASTSDVELIFYQDGREVSRAENVGAGYAERFLNGRFNKIRITSAAGSTIKLIMRLGNEVRFDAPPTGAVTISGQQGTFTQAQKTVTNASAQLLAANASRRYLLIQNKDASGDIYVTLDGTAATTTKGIKIAAGGSLEVANYCPSGEIFAIGSIASNANCVAVEG